MDYNRVMLGGRLTKDPELRTLPSGSDVVSFGIATNRKWKADGGEQKEEVLFVDVEMFGKQAATLHQHFQKGSSIFIEGRLKLDSWESQDGSKRTKVKVIAENFRFVGDKKDSGGGEGQAPAPKRTFKTGGSQTPAGSTPTQVPVSETFDDDSIPF